MGATVAIVLRLCTLRAGPQDLPHSLVLLVASIAVQVVVNALTLLGRLGASQAALAGAVYTLMLVALVHTTLMLRERGARAVQTLSALNLADALIGLVGWALAAALGAALPEAVLQIPLLVWFLAVFGHILRESLEIGRATAIALAVLYFLLAAGATGAFVEIPQPEP
jgi:hypothetical protein